MPAATPRRKGRTWLLIAGLLFAAGAFVAALSDKPPTAPPRVKVPRMDADAWKRLQGRRTLPRTEEAVAPFDGRQTPPRDPMIAALPPTVRMAALVIEANALRYSPVGQLLVACLLRGAGNPLESLQKQIGIDPLKDVDRVAFVDGTVMVSGFFQNARWDGARAGSTREALGAHAVIWTGPEGKPFGVWKDSLAILGTRAEISAAVDRLEGNADDGPPVLSELDSYGEIYGVVMPALIGGLLGAEDPALGERIRTVASAVRLHVDASHDVGISAEVTGTQAEATRDLAQAVGAGLVLARLRAVQQGDDAMAEVLDFARVNPGNPDNRQSTSEPSDGFRTSRDGLGPAKPDLPPRESAPAGFEVELGLPLSLFQRRLEHCMAAPGSADAGAASGG